mgnify:CR=1 FL=1
MDAFAFVVRIVNQTKPDFQTTDRFAFQEFSKDTVTLKVEDIAGNLSEPVKQHSNAGQFDPAQGNSVGTESNNAQADSREPQLVMLYPVCAFFRFTFYLEGVRCFLYIRNKRAS